MKIGGAVIPTIMSLYLLVGRGLWVPGAIATAIVAVVLHWLANPVPGVGIAVPVSIPAIVTAVVSLLLSRINTAPLAYISGSMGTLIGADLTNLDKVWSWRAGCIDRRRRHLRWHLSHRHPRRAAGRARVRPPGSLRSSVSEPRTLVQKRRVANKRPSTKVVQKERPGRGGLGEGFQSVGQNLARRQCEYRVRQSCDNCGRAAARVP
jgi:hypothetical protein